MEFTEFLWIKDSLRRKRRKILVYLESRTLKQIPSIPELSTIKISLINSFSPLKLLIFCEVLGYYSHEVICVPTKSYRNPDSDSWHSLEVLWVKSVQMPVPRVYSWNVSLNYLAHFFSMSHRDSVYWRYNLWSALYHRTSGKPQSIVKMICTWQRLNNYGYYW